MPNETAKASLGYVTAYGAAKRGGYLGTYEEWCALMAEVADHLEQNESLYADTTTAKEAAEAAQGYAEVAQGKAEDAQTAAETAQGKAEDAEDAAEAWAAGTSGGTPSATNNASYYAGQASDSATASAASAASAEAWATGGSSGTSSATNNAKYYSDQAEDSAEAAEAWATGGSGGTASASNNAKYYSEQAATSATAAAAVGTNFAPTFSSSTAYSAGDYVMYNGTQYRFTANHAAGAWTGSDAVAEPISPVVADLKTHLYREISFDLIPNSYWVISGAQAGNPASANGWARTSRISCVPGEVLKITSTVASNYNVFFDSDTDGDINSSLQITVGENIITVPQGANYFALSNTNAGMENTSIVMMVTGKDFEENTKDIADINKNINDILNNAWLSGLNSFISPKIVDNFAVYGSTGTRARTALFNTDNAYAYEVTVNDSDFEYASYFGLTGYDDAIPGGPSGWQSTSFIATKPNELYTVFYITARKADNSAFSEEDVANLQNAFSLKIFYKEDNNEEIYISSTGNDLNDGTVDYPILTVNEALKRGKTKINISAGQYTQTIDLSYTDKRSIEIKNISESGDVIFLPEDYILAKTANTVTGYTKVKSTSLTAALSNDITYIWQNGVEDANSEILDSERLAIQKGKVYRLNDTRIIKCSNTVLADALTEIETSDICKWFLDGTTLYFSSPESVSASCPICADLGNEFITNGSREKTIKLYGITAKYMMFTVRDLNSPECYECVSLYSSGEGGFSYNNSLSAKFVRCEAAGCAHSSNGDGFNGHSSRTSGDGSTKQTVSTHIDCWSHDNYDDGWSDHERCRTTIIGGLYEYNGKSGLAPASGCQLSAYNVISRRNWNGFICVGSMWSEDKTKNTSMLCLNCLAENNNTGGTTLHRRGFRVSEEGNNMRLINCKVIGSAIGYENGTGCTAELMDCSVKNVTTNTSGTVTINNTELVS